jgi:flavoprotein
MNIAWGITGAGHLLPGCIDLIQELRAHTGEAVRIEVFLSRAAEEVVQMYRLRARLHQAAQRVLKDNKASAPIVGRFYRSYYKVLVVAPATSNSVAQFVCGISSALIPNLFAQAGKNRVPILVLPTDTAAEMDTLAPNGQMVKVYPRAIDLENTDKLRAFSGVTVVEEIESLRRWLNTYL